jgi:hypothetical protein
MRTLILVAGKGLPRTDAPEAVYVAWDASAEATLGSRGVAFKTIVDYLGRDGADILDEAAMAWVKGLGRVPFVDGRTFRELAQWRGVSLWWFAELYLYHDTRLPHAVRLIETLSGVARGRGAACRARVYRARHPLPWAATSAVAGPGLAHVAHLAGESLQ